MHVMGQKFLTYTFSSYHFGIQTHCQALADNGPKSMICMASVSCNFGYTCSSLFNFDYTYLASSPGSSQLFSVARYNAEKLGGAWGQG